MHMRLGEHVGRRRGAEVGGGGGVGVCAAPWVLWAPFPRQAAMRYGHSEVNEMFLRLDEDHAAPLRVGAKAALSRTASAFH